jgi:hypothetical protein
MESASVTFTTNEAQVLIQLIDIAVKAQGLAAAEAGLVLTRKVQQAFSESGAEIPTLNPQPAPQDQGNVGDSGCVGDGGCIGDGGSAGGSVGGGFTTS